MSCSRKRQRLLCRSTDDGLFEMGYDKLIARDYFFYNDRAARLREQLEGFKFMVERSVDGSLSRWGVTYLLEGSHLMGTVVLPDNPARIAFEEGVVRDFYANLEKRAGVSRSAYFGQVYVHVEVFEFNPTRLNQVLGTKNVGGVTSGASIEEIAKELTGDIIEHWPESGVLRDQLTKKYCLLHEIGSSNWYPTSDQNYVSLGRGLDFNFGEYIFRQLLHQTEGATISIFSYSGFCSSASAGIQGYFTGKFNNHRPGAIRVSRELLQCNAKVDDLTKLATSPTPATGERWCIMVRDFIHGYLNKQLELKRGEVASLEAQIKALSIGGLTKFPPSSPNGAEGE